MVSYGDGHMGVSEKCSPSPLHPSNLHIPWARTGLTAICSPKAKGTRVWDSGDQHD